MGSLKTSLAVAFTLIMAIAIVAVAIIYTAPRTSTAPDFHLRDIFDQEIAMNGLRGKVVVLDFMYILCEGCKIVTDNLQQIIPLYSSDLVIISIDIIPTESDAALQSYRTSENITWQVASDTDSVASKYGVGASLPHVIIVDKNGKVTWNWLATGPINPGAQKADMQKAIDEAMNSVALPTSVAQTSVGALAILAAIGSFFSPCSFPLLPGYMAYYLGADAESKQKPTMKTAAGRGFLAALGMILFYGIVAAIVLPLGFTAAAFLPFLGPVVGVILIVLGALTLTPLQYHKIIEPFRRLRQRIFPAKEEAEQKQRMGVKMFAYGVGYGAAGFACVAPPFIAAILNATIYGSILYGLLVLVVYSVIVIALMIAITILLSEAGQAAVKKMNRYVNVIKKVSGIALIIAGAYLLYFWYISNR